MPDQHEKMIKLRPVNFVYKNDTQNSLQYGLIAEEVHEIYPELVAFDERGEIYTINYMALIPLLLKQIQEHENFIQELEAQVAIQGNEIKKVAVLEEQMAALKALIARLMV
jgi:hypothetical protein